MGTFNLVKFLGESELFSHLVEIPGFVNGGRVGSLGVCKHLIVVGNELWDATELDLDLVGRVEVNGLLVDLDSSFFLYKSEEGDIHVFARRVLHDNVSKFIKLVKCFEGFVHIFEFIRKHQTC